MLDFLVLGIVPGTSITLTITWILVIGLIMSLSALAYIEYKKLNNTKDQESKKLDLLSKIVRQA